jgi:hypothetical protein
MKLRSLAVIALILLFPFSVAAFDLLQEKSQIVYSSGDFITAGRQALAKGEYQVALNNFNRAEELIAASPGNKYDQLISMTQCERGKAETYNGMGNTAAAQSATAKANDYENRANHISTTEGWCIIATATFGSPMAPQVQQLREFRQNNIYTTESGAQFMIAFNAWYYSFSPVVAHFINDHPVTKPPMQALLTPVLGILSLAKWSYSLVSFMPEAAVIVSGLVAGTLIGMVYAFPLLFVLLVVIRKIHPFTFNTGIFNVLGISAAAGFACLGYGGLLSVRPVLLVGSVLFVVSLVLLTGLFLSWVCMNRLDGRPTGTEPE